MSKLELLLFWNNTVLIINKIFILIFCYYEGIFFNKVSLKRENRFSYYCNRATKLKLHYTDRGFDFWAKNANLNQLTPEHSTWRKGKGLFDFCNMYFTKILNCALFSVFYATIPVIWFPCFLALALKSDLKRSPQFCRVVPFQIYDFCFLLGLPGLGSLFFSMSS